MSTEPNRNPAGSDWRERDKHLKKNRQREISDGMIKHTREMCDQVYINWMVKKYEREERETSTRCSWAFNIRARKGRIDEINKAYLPKKLKV